MRQLVELRDYLPAFEALDAEIVAIAQLERDPAMLTRVAEFVGDGITIVADPREETAEHFELFSTYLVDDGRLATSIPGSLQARASLDVILVELAKLAGAEALPELQTALGEPAPVSATSPEQVVDARWMWSHPVVAPGEAFKLAFVADVAPGWHLYGEGGEFTMPTTVELELPDGITLEVGPNLPKPHLVHDPVLDLELPTYEGALPLSTIELRADDDLAPGDYVARLRLGYQACDAAVCLPPTTKVFELPLSVGHSEAERRAVARWEQW